jgi:hypothetical protein
VTDQPRNITPEDEREQLTQEQLARTADEPDWTGATWPTSRGRPFPWLGVLLVLVGLALLIQTVMPPDTLSAGTVLLFALGGALVVGWLFGGSWLAAIPGLLLLALGIARMVGELNIYQGQGTTALSLAVAFVLIWLIGLTRQRKSRWPLVAAAVLAVIGIVQVSGQLANLPELSFIWPVVIVVVGVLLLISGRRS